MWAGGFRAGPVADWTYYDGRPYGWTLGTATDRAPRCGEHVPVPECRRAAFPIVLTPYRHTASSGRCTNAPNTLHALPSSDPHLGTQERIPAPVDEAVRAGMREGGWRRLVVPAAYGEVGLRRINYLKGGGRYTPAKAGFAIRPQEVAYFDLVMLDGGSGRCDRLLRPQGVAEADATRLRSKLCMPGDVSTDGPRLV